jgi:hypothetical protein
VHRFKIGIVLAALTALGLTGLAVADENNPANTVPVAAHFTAGGDAKTSGCLVAKPAATTPGNTPTIAGLLETKAQLAGTSTSADKRLNGPVRISLKAVVNRTGMGTATGTFRIPGKIDATIVAVVSGGNRYDGFLRNTNGSRRLFANFSATLSGSAIAGDLGGGSHLNTAVIGRINCNNA